MSDEKFQRDLETGEKFEARFADWANRVHGCWYAKQAGYFKDYDLLCTHCHVTVECKSDRLQQKTNNFCFELPMLKDSKADILAYETSDFVHLFNLPKLREWCREYYTKKPRALVNGGDRQANQMLVVPYWVLAYADFKQVVHMRSSKKPVIPKLLR